MTKSSQDIIVQIVDEIISGMSLEDRVYLLEHPGVTS
jgi:hypothetical protein